MTVYSIFCLTVFSVLIFIFFKYRENRLQKIPKSYNIHYINNKDEICHITGLTRVQRDIILQALKQTWLTSAGQHTAHNIHVEPIFEVK